MTTSTTKPVSRRTEDDRVFLHGVSWDDFERILAIRGESSGVRMTYLEGELELMSPSREHEGVGRLIERLLWEFAEAHQIALNSFGSWTITKRADERALEPDACFVIGSVDLKGMTRPDLAIEINWTRGGIDKLEVYRALEVPEVWIWEDGRIVFYVLRKATYVVSERSELMPALDIELLLRFVDLGDQMRAVQGYRAALRGESKRSS